MTLTNRTPHVVMIRLPGGAECGIPPEGDPIRVAAVHTDLAAIDVLGERVPCVKASWDFDVIEAAARQIVDASSYGRHRVIVSGMVLDALSARDSDVQAAALRVAVAPDTSPESVVRFDYGPRKGQIKCVRRFRFRDHP